MKMNTVPAAHGKDWITQGFALFRQHAKTIVLYVFLYLLVIAPFGIAPQFLPLLVGVPIIIILYLVGPALIVGLLGIYRALDQGQPASLGVFLQPFKTRLAPLCALGALYTLAIAVVLVIGAGIFVVTAGGDLQRLLQVFVASMNDTLTLADAEYLLSVLLGLMFTELVVLSLMLPLFMAYYFAPLLVAWDNVSVVKAVVFSFVACLKNWRPFLLFSLLLMVGSMMVATVVATLIVMLVLALPKTLALLIAGVLYLAMIALLLSLCFAFYYVSYKDIFTPDEA
ncbi:hypothetical protein AGMMS49545_18630 [Betaproteobacteria bacterium]|nr:hypothetical protein AGMMS49545_18630 [Betaproteobacteria bacterium]GHU41899.1 hypothetical protein AGMMS50289_05780 [Betaproteobacteria bacterium]